MKSQEFLYTANTFMKKNVYFHPSSDKSGSKTLLLIFSRRRNRRTLCEYRKKKEEKKRKRKGVRARGGSRRCVYGRNIIHPETKLELVACASNTSFVKVKIPVLNINPRSDDSKKSVNLNCNAESRTTYFIFYRIMQQHAEANSGEREREGR